jgi:hypothetical protein
MRVRYRTFNAAVSSTRSAVPSLYIHNASSTRKYSRSAKSVNWCSLGPRSVPEKLASDCVPAAVPSLVHRSVSLGSGLVVKYRPSKVAVRFRGSDDSIPGVRSATRIVPSAVPSLFHNSVPPSSSKASKNMIPSITTKG